MEYSVRGEYLRGDFFVFTLDFVHELYTLFCVQISFAFRSFMLFYVQFFAAVIVFREMSIGFHLPETGITEPGMILLGEY